MQPCGGAIPLCMVDEFDIPAEIIDRKVTKMKMISPSNREVDVGKTLSETEYIGMCRREVRSIIHTSIGACAELLSLSLSCQYCYGYGCCVPPVLKSLCARPVLCRLLSKLACKQMHRCWTTTCASAPSRMAPACTTASLCAWSR